MVKNEKIGFPLFNPAPHGKEVIHHKNHIRNDNRIENLMVMTRGEHTRIHTLGNKNWLGKKHTEETKRKMSISMTGLKHVKR